MQRLILSRTSSPLRHQLLRRIPHSHPPATTTTTPATATATASLSPRAPPNSIVFQQGIALSRAMASDQDYMDFLNKANADPGAGYEAKNSASVQGAAGKAAFKTLDEGADIPAPIRDATSRDLFYTSDADEPFVPVALRWADEGGKGLPDEDDFARLIQHREPSKADIQILDPMDWDRHGQYAELLEAVRRAVEGNDVRVYRIARDGTRAEYWLVGREGSGKDARIVGVKALAVES